MKLYSRYYLLSFGIWIIFSSSSSSQLLEGDFKNVNEIIVNIHAPIVEKKLNSTIELHELYFDFGGAFKVDSALRPIGEPSFIITLTGEIPQSAPMSMDGYAIVACHELGHILGGEPRQTKKLSKWSSVEGQADYYATNECMWKYVKSLKAFDVIHEFNKTSVSRCNRVFGGNIEKMLGCLRIMSGIQAMVDYFNRNASFDQQISMDKEDTTEVTKTLQKYPSPQCRVDTWVAGVFNLPRPRCWFYQ